MRTLLLPVLVTLAAFPALASPEYPGTVKVKLGLVTIPQCTLCHATNAGGAGTANRPFADSARDLGLSGGSDTTQLEGVLDAMQAAGTDSDMDGTPDIEELTNGRNPNVADGTGGGDGGTDGGVTCPGGVTPNSDGSCPPLPPEIPEPSYGCSSVHGGIAAFLAALLGFWLLAARREGRE